MRVRGASPVVAALAAAFLATACTPASGPILANPTAPRPPIASPTAPPAAAVDPSPIQLPRSARKMTYSKPKRRVTPSAAAP
jgi:hypothetical protein